MQYYLDKLRFKYDWTEEMTADSLGNPARDDYETQQMDEHFSAYIKSCGYHYSWLNNLFVCFLIACTLLFIWLVLLLKDFLMRRYWHKKSTNERFMTNFSLRFVYEIIFEVILCTILYMSMAGHTEISGATALTIFGSLAVIAMFAVLVFCLSRT